MNKYRSIHLPEVILDNVLAYSDLNDLCNFTESQRLIDPVIVSLVHRKLSEGVALFYESISSSLSDPDKLTLKDVKVESAYRGFRSVELSICKVKNQFIQALTGKTLNTQVIPPPDLCRHLSKNRVEQANIYEFIFKKRARYRHSNRPSSSILSKGRFCKPRHGNLRSRYGS